jgi:hypothetical protein
VGTTKRKEMNTMANIAKKYINNEISYLRQFNNSAADACMKAINKW